MNLPLTKYLNANYRTIMVFGFDGEI